MAGLFVDLTPGPGSSTAGSTDYSITCTVTEIGLITPSITWRGPGDMVISTDTDFTMGAVTGSGPTYSSVLMFNSLKTSQAGEYTCTAEVNSMTDVSTIAVNVTSMSLQWKVCCSDVSCFVSPSVPPPSGHCVCAQTTHQPHIPDYSEIYE